MLLSSLSKILSLVFVVCLFYLTDNLSVCFSHLSVYLPVYIFYLTVYLSVCLFYLSVYLPVFIFHLSVYFTCLFICLSTYFTCQFILLVCLSVCLFVSIKRQNCWTIRVKFFCSNSHDPWNGLWLLESKKCCPTFFWNFQVKQKFPQTFVFMGGG